MQPAEHAMRTKAQSDCGEGSVANGSLELVDGILEARPFIVCPIRNEDKLDAVVLVLLASLSSGTVLSCVLGVFREGVFQKMPALEGQFLKESSVRFAGENHLRTQRNTQRNTHTHTHTQNKALRRGS